MTSHELLNWPWFVPFRPLFFVLSYLFIEIWMAALWMGINWRADYRSIVAYTFLGIM